MDGYFGYMNVHDYKHVCTSMHECANILIRSRRAKSTLDLMIVTKKLLDRLIVGLRQP